LEGLIGWPIQLGFEGYKGKSAGYSSFEIVVPRMQSLNILSFYHFSIIMINYHPILDILPKE
jgi:hypothetical protein